MPVPGVAQHEDSSELLAYVPTVSLPVSRVRIATRGLVLFLGVCCLPARCSSYKRTTYKALEAHSVEDRTRQANSKERNVPKERSIEKGSERKGIAKRKKYR